jgi:hypothetical protein
VKLFVPGDAAAVAVGAAAVAASLGAAQAARGVAAEIVRSV